MKRKILLVDDKPEFLQLVKLFLSRRFDVETSENGLQALLKLQSGYMPEIIISDLVMPVADGKTLIGHLKNSGTLKHIPVIILSSIDKSNERIELLRSGASDYLVKPFNPEELEVRVIRLFNKDA